MADRALAAWGVALQKRTWGTSEQQGGMALSLPWQQERAAALTGESYRSREVISPSLSPLIRLCLSSVPSLGPPSVREMNKLEGTSVEAAMALVWAGGWTRDHPSNLNYPMILCSMSLVLLETVMYIRQPLEVFVGTVYSALSYRKVGDDVQAQEKDEYYWVWMVCGFLFVSFFLSFPPKIPNSVTSILHT